MTILSYKGYQSSVEYEDEQLVIQLLHIDDFISTTCDSATEVESAFHDLVDDYLATCTEAGRAPNKPYKGSLNIRMPAELHRRLAMVASAAGISLNAWIVRACKAAVSAPPQWISAGERYTAARHVILPAKHQKVDWTENRPDNVVDLAELRRINEWRVKSAL